MMKKQVAAALLAAGALGMSLTNAKAEVAHRIGVGTQYWMTIDDIEMDNVDENGFSYMISYQLRPLWLVKLELDLELLPKYYGGYPSESYAPQAYAVIGGWIYGALGVGIIYSDGEFADAPFYSLRAGVNFPIPFLSFIYVDVYGNYRFQDWEKTDTLSEELDTDTIMLGAAVRFEF